MYNVGLYEMISRDVITMLCRSKQYQYCLCVMYTDSIHHIAVWCMYSLIYPLTEQFLDTH